MQMNENNQFNIPRARTEVTEPTPENFDTLDNVRASRDYLFLKIIAIVLASLLLTLFLRSVFINPMAEFTFSTGIAQSCRIRIVSEGLYSDLRKESVVKVDGNLISIDDNKYYEIGGNTVYEHYQAFNGTWITNNIVGEAFELGGDSATQNLFNYKSYEKKPGKIFAWQIKQGVDVGDFRNVELTRKGGKTVIIAYVEMTKITITLDRIGRTKVDTPWE